MGIEEQLQSALSALHRPSKATRCCGAMFDLALFAFGCVVVVVVCGSIAATMAAFAWMAWQWASAGSGL